jgi:hypothetical protein
MLFWRVGHWPAYGVTSDVRFSVRYLGEADGQKSIAQVALTIEPAVNKGRTAATSSILLPATCIRLCRVSRSAAFLFIS